jgi:two-component system, OmpR family, response regulator
MQKEKYSGILILDDEKFMRENIVDYLEDSELFKEIYQAESGEKALEYVNNDECKFRYLIVDLCLPGISGQEFMQKAKEIKKDLVFIVHTANVNYKIPENGKELGIYGLIKKPCRNLDDFIKIIQKGTNIYPQK